MPKHRLTRRHVLSYSLVGSAIAGASSLGLPREVYAQGPKMNIYNDNWMRRENCDIHVIEWLDQQRITDATIYHFGTGGHHHVGGECAKPERRNSVLGITASPEE